MAKQNNRVLKQRFFWILAKHFDLLLEILPSFSFNFPYHPLFHFHQINHIQLVIHYMILKYSLYHIIMNHFQIYIYSLFLRSTLLTSNLENNLNILIQKSMLDKIISILIICYQLLL